jgi:Tetratricopeptide repeat
MTNDIFQKALTAQQKQNWAEAERLYRSMLSGPKRPIEVLANLAVVLEAEQQFPEALELLLEANTLKPEHFGILSNIGNLFRALEEYESAIGFLQKAIAANPQYAAAYNNLADCYKDTNRIDEAIQFYTEALRLDPRLHQTRYNRGLVQLYAGKFEEGWADWPAHRLHKKTRKLPWPEWRGEDLAGKNIYLWNDQGLGDEILFASIIPNVLAKGAKIYVETAPRLTRFFAQSFADVIVLPRQADHADIQPAPVSEKIDYEASTIHLASILRRSFKDFEPRQAYMKASDEAVIYRQTLLQKGFKKIVGLSWKSQAKRLGLYKSMTLQHCKDIIAGHPDTLFLDLQYGDTAEERRQFLQDNALTNFYHDDGVNPMGNIAPFADAIAACDAVVTISNTTAHVAGALGLPTYVLMHHSQGSLWYWFRDLAASPWYKNVQVYRQDRPGEWLTPLAQLARDMDTKLRAEPKLFQILEI